MADRQWPSPDGEYINETRQIQWQSPDGQYINEKTVQGHGLLYAETRNKLVI